MQNTMVCFVFVAFHQLTGTAHLKKDFLQLFMKENHKVMFLFSVTETSILRQVSYTTTTTTTHTVTATQTVHESGAETSDTSSVPRSHFISDSGSPSTPAELHRFKKASCGAAGEWHTPAQTD